MTKQEPQRIDFPENIAAERHEVSGKWTLHYLTDEQAVKCSAAMQAAPSEALRERALKIIANGSPIPVDAETTVQLVQLVRELLATPSPAPVSDEAGEVDYTLSKTLIKELERKWSGWLDHGPRDLIKRLVQALKEERFKPTKTALDCANEILNINSQIYRKRHDYPDWKAEAARLWAIHIDTAIHAAKIESQKRVAALEVAMKEACDLLAERKYGSPARSSGHNARLTLESALSPETIAEGV